MPTVYPTDTQINNNKNYDFVKDVSQAGWELADFLFGAKSIKKIAEGNGTWGDALTVGVNAATLFIPPAKLLKYTTPALEKLIKAASVISQHTNVMSEVGLSSAEKTSTFARALLNERNKVTSSHVYDRFIQAAKGSYVFPEGKRIIEKPANAKSITDKELNKIWREYRVTKALEDYRHAETAYAQHQDFIKGLVSEGKISSPAHISETQDALEAARKNLDNVIHENTNYRSEWNVPQYDIKRDWITGEPEKEYDTPYRLPVTPEGIVASVDNKTPAFTSKEDFFNGIYNKLSDTIDNLAARMKNGLSEDYQADKAKFKKFVDMKNEYKKALDETRPSTENINTNVQNKADAVLAELESVDPELYKQIIHEFGYEKYLDPETGELLTTIEKQTSDYNRVSDASIRIGEGTPHESLPEHVDPDTVESTTPSLAESPHEARMNDLQEELDSLLHDLHLAEVKLDRAKIIAKKPSTIRTAQSEVDKINGKIKFTREQLNNVSVNATRTLRNAANSPAQSLYNALTPTVEKKAGEKSVKAFNAWREHEILKGRVKSLEEKINIAKNKNAPTGALEQRLSKVQDEISSLRSEILDPYTKMTSRALAEIKTDLDITEFLNIMGKKWMKDKAHHADYALSFSRVLNILKTQTNDPAITTRLDAALSFLKENKNVQRSETFLQALSRAGKEIGKVKINETEARVLAKDKEELAALREEFKNATDPAVKDRLAKRGIALKKSIEEREGAIERAKPPAPKPVEPVKPEPKDDDGFNSVYEAWSKATPEERAAQEKINEDLPYWKKYNPEMDAEGYVRYRNLPDVVVHSGGAKGADTAWAEAADWEGIRTVAHSFEGHESLGSASGFVGKRPKLEQRNNLTQQELREQTPLLKKVQRVLYGQENVGTSTAGGKLVHRNAYQVKDSDAVLAVVTGFKKIHDGSRMTVGGRGTPWAVEMGILLKKPVYTFEQNAGKWFKFNPDTKIWDELSGLPPKYKSFAGIGTASDLKANGRKAIKDYITSLTVPDIPKLEKGTVARWNRLTTAEQKESVYIGRGTGDRGKFGNPFPVGNGVSVKESVDKYRTWLWQKIKEDAQYARDLYELKGKRLACPGGEPNDQCHGQVILKAIEWLDSHPEAMKGK
jgi:hypothetical protein